mgnify:CR=1 FL=1
MTPEHLARKWCPGTANPLIWDSVECRCDQCLQIRIAGAVREAQKIEWDRCSQRIDALRNEIAALKGKST